MNQNDPHVAHKEPHMAHKEPHVDQESEPHVALCEPHMDCNEPHVARREPDEIFFLQCRIDVSYDFLCFFSIFGGGQTAAKTNFASSICCKDSPFQFSAKSDNSKYGLLQPQITSVPNILIFDAPLCSELLIEKMFCYKLFCHSYHQRDTIRYVA